MTTNPTKSEAENVPSEWIEMIREIVQRDRHAVRPGECREIHIQSKMTGRFCALNLPGNRLSFSREMERDAVIERILRPYARGELAGLNSEKV